MQPGLPRHAAGRQAGRHAGVILVCMLLATPIRAQDITDGPPAPTDPVRDYLHAIDRAEAEYSAYSMELADLYLGLGQSLLEREELDDARKAFQHGMQIVRVNFGLNSLEQSNYLFPIAEIESRLGDWKTADKVLQNVYSINSRTHGANDPDMLPVLSQLMNWYLQRRPTQSVEDGYRNLSRSGALAGRMAEIIERDKGLGHPDTAAMYRRLGQLHYYMAEQLSRFDASSQPAMTFSTSSPAASQTAYGISINTHFVGGKTAYMKVAESVGQDERSSPVQRAEAMAQLADWYLIFGKNQTAGKTYQQAYEILANSADAERLTQDFFGQPTPLRFLKGESDNPAQHPDGPTGKAIQVSMTVTRHGRLQNIEFLDPPDDLGSEELRGLERRLRRQRFRPRLIDGAPQETEGFIWHYSPRGMEG